MSVVRSAYRQLLRVGTRVSDKYADPNDMCFALFGLLVTRQDFVNAGYRGSFPAILRTCFLRPSVVDDPHDAASARISAAFDALRRLNEISASDAAFRVRELRLSVAEAEEEVSAAAGGDGGSSSASVASAAKKEKAGESGGAAPMSPSSTASIAAASAPSSPPSVAAPTLNAAVAAATSNAAACPLDEGVDLIRGSLLIERSPNQRIQNFPRHCVVCSPISMVFPPYRFCLPPEPAYLLAVRNEFALHGITDVLLALSATSLFNAHRQAHLRGASDDDEGGSPARSTTASNSAAELTRGKKGTADSVASCSSTAAELVPRGFPTCREELRLLVRKIPTRTVAQTDVLEVEITTEYVCSNPAAASPGADGTPSTIAAAAAAQKQKTSRDSVFTSTTPLKSGPLPSSRSVGGGSNSGNRQTGASLTDSATSGPGSAVAEDDDTKAHLFLYYVCVRNRGPQKNPHRWHAQILSHHLVVVDVAQAQVLEMGRPGVMGNFPMLPPGASHCFESGTTLSGPEGILRGSIQVNLFNDAGEMLMLDAAIAPTRLTVEVTSAKGFTNAKNAREELVERTSDEDTSDAVGKT
ncbi:ApaG domain containing protein [Lotmaria passim]